MQMHSQVQTQNQGHKNNRTQHQTTGEGHSKKNQTEKEVHTVARGDVWVMGGQVAAKKVIQTAAGTGEGFWPIIRAFTLILVIFTVFNTLKPP